MKIFCCENCAICAVSIGFTFAGGESYSLQPKTSSVQSVRSSSLKPCPDCIVGKNTMLFEEWSAKHLKRPGPADGTCAGSREKIIFKGTPNKCCCEPSNNPRN